MPDADSAGSAAEGAPAPSDTLAPTFHRMPILGGSLCVSTRGEGKPVVLLHKLGGNGAEWEHIAAPLSRDRQVIVVELPGHGGSEMTCEPPLLLTHAVLAALIAQALDLLGVHEPVDLAGSSVGGSIAMAFAAMFPDRVDRVVSLGASWTDGSSREAIEAAAKAQVGAEYDADGTPIRRTLGQLQAFGLADEAQAERLNQGRAAAGRWVAPIARSVAFDRFAAFLDRVRAPVTFAYGARGHYGAYAAKGAAQTSAASVVEIADASAFPHEDRPFETLALIRRALG